MGNVGEREQEEEEEIEEERRRCWRNEKKE